MATDTAVDLARAADAAAGELIVEGRLVEGGAAVRITVRDGIVAAMDRIDAAADDRWIGPGWIDLQINGFDGHDPNGADASPDVVEAMVRAMWRTGVAAAAITICTESEQRMIASLRAVAGACERDALIAASVVGIHVEGPHIAREDGPRGAHPLEFIRPPDIAEYRRWQDAAGGSIRIVTVSPEYDEAIPYIRAIVADGVVASIGHTAATGDQIRAAVDAGARWSTHLGNGAHAMLPRHPNYVWDQLSEDRLSAGFIFDGHHLPASVMQPFVRAKGVERTILVSDAVSFAGLPPGIYDAFSGAQVELTAEGRLQLHGTPVPRRSRGGAAGVRRECRAPRRGDARRRRSDGHGQPGPAARLARRRGPRERPDRGRRQPDGLPPIRRHPRDRDRPDGRRGPAGLRRLTLVASWRCRSRPG